MAIVICSAAALYLVCERVVWWFCQYELVQAEHFFFSAAKVACNIYSSVTFLVSY